MPCKKSSTSKVLSVLVRPRSLIWAWKIYFGMAFMCKLRERGDKNANCAQMFKDVITDCYSLKNHWSYKGQYLIRLDLGKQWVKL